MSMAALLYLAAVSAGIGLHIRTVSTRRTDPPGYTHVATCDSLPEAGRAKTVLEQQGILVRLDDHSDGGWRGVQVGSVRLLVPDQRVGEAVELLRSHVASEQRQRYMRLTS